MTRHIREQSLLALLRGDEALFRQLRSAGLIPLEEAGLAPEHLELARVAYTLVHELEVNWAGVEVVLHLRTQLVATQRQVGDLIVQLRDRQRPP